MTSDISFREIPHGAGYIKLYRKLLSSAVFEDEGLLKVWVWCLLRANWTEATTMFEGKQITLEQGQFITGRFTGSKECSMKSSTFRNRLKKLSEMRQIVIKSDNKKSMITVRNYWAYQSTDGKNGQQMDNRWTTDGQQMDTDKNIRSKEVKKLRRVATAKAQNKERKTKSSNEKQNLTAIFGRSN